MTFHYPVTISTFFNVLNASKVIFEYKNLFKSFNSLIDVVMT